MRYILLLIISISYFPIKAQFVKEVYKELPTNNYQSTPQLFSLDKNGLFLYQMNANIGNKLSLQRLDTNLDSVWVNEYELPNNYRVINHYFDKKLYFYILAAPYSNKAFTILQINLIDGTIKDINGALPFVTYMEEVKVLGDNVFIIGEHREEKVALKLGLGEELASVIPSFYERRMQIKGFFEDTFTNEMNFLVSYRDNCEFALKTYSNILGIKPAEELKIGEEYSLNQGLFHSFNHDNKLVIGTYSPRCNDESEGISTILYQKNSKPRVTYIRFTDFRNYFNYLSEKKVNRIAKRIERKQAKGKPFILRDHIFLKPELTIKTENEWLVLAEGYDEEYQQVQSRNQNAPDQIFLGYQYSNATIMGLDSTGKKIWDNTIKIENVINKKLESNIEIGFLEDSIILAYETQGDIYSKLIHRYDVQKELTEQKGSDIVEDENLSTYSNQFIHWYEHYFLLVGPRQNFFSNKRPYYIYKLAYESDLETKEEEDSQ